MEVSQKTKNGITIRSSNPTPGHIFSQNDNYKRYTHPYIHSSTSHNSQDMETTWIAINRWAGKEDVVCAYIYNRLLLSHEKNECHLQQHGCNQRLLSEEKDKYHMMSFLCENWNLTQMHLSMKQKHGHRLVAVKGHGGTEGWTGSLGLVDKALI